MRTLLSNYLDEIVDASKLNDVAWEMIDLFSKCSNEELPQFSPDERIFWYVIWQIQHLADDAHEADGTSVKSFRQGLEYLKHPEKVPHDLVGLRPQRK